MEYALRESDKNILLPPPPLSKDEELKNIGHSMNIRNLNFGVNSVTVSYLIRYDSFLQNATGFLLQNPTVQILLAACRRSAMVRISDNGLGWK